MFEKTNSPSSPLEGAQPLILGLHMEVGQREALVFPDEGAFFLEGIYCLVFHGIPFHEPTPVDPVASPSQGLEFGFERAKRGRSLSTRGVNPLCFVPVEKLPVIVSAQKPLVVKRSETHGTLALQFFGTGFRTEGAALSQKALGFGGLWASEFARMCVASPGTSTGRPKP